MNIGDRSRPLTSAQAVAAVGRAVLRDVHARTQAVRAVPEITCPWVRGTGAIDHNELHQHFDTDDRTQPDRPVPNIVQQSESRRWRRSCQRRRGRTTMALLSPTRPRAIPRPSAGCLAGILRRSPKCRCTPPLPDGWPRPPSTNLPITLSFPDGTALGNRWPAAGARPARGLLRAARGRRADRVRRGLDDRRPDRRWLDGPDAVRPARRGGPARGMTGSPTGQRRRPTNWPPS